MSPCPYLTHKLLVTSFSLFCPAEKGKCLWWDSGIQPGSAHHTSSLFCLLGIWKFFSFVEIPLEWLLWSSEPSTGYCPNIHSIGFCWRRYFCANGSKEEKKVSTVWTLACPSVPSSVQRAHELLVLLERSWCSMSCSFSAGSQIKKLCLQ